MGLALLLIDLQNDYFPGGKMELVNSDEAVKKAAKIVKFFRKKKLPIIHIQHLSVRPGSTFFIPNTEGAKIHPAVEPLPNEVVFHKNYPNSFRNTGLLDYLKENSIKDLVICGMMTHMCVDATTRAAFDFGFNCTVISDSCASRKLIFEHIEVPAQYVHTSFLSALSIVYAKVISTEEFLHTSI